MCPANEITGFLNQLFLKKKKKKKKKKKDKKKEMMNQLDFWRDDKIKKT